MIPDEENMEVVVAPLEPRFGIAPHGASLADGSKVSGWNVVRLEYRSVDRSLMGVRSWMVEDSYQTRGNFARAPFVNRGGGSVGRGYRPYR